MLSIIDDKIHIKFYHAHAAEYSEQRPDRLQGLPNPRGDQLEMILGIADRQLDPAPPATTSRSNNFIEI